MKQRSQGFKFRGFVALADMLFALSAGLLLLNPIRFASPPPARSLKREPEQRHAPAVIIPPRPAETVKSVPAQPRAQAIIVEVQKVEEHLDKLESDGRQIQAQAIKLLKTE